MSKPKKHSPRHQRAYAKITSIISAIEAELSEIEERRKLEDESGEDFGPSSSQYRHLESGWIEVVTDQLNWLKEIIENEPDYLITVIRARIKHLKRERREQERETPEGPWEANWQTGSLQAYREQIDKLDDTTR